MKRAKTLRRTKSVALFFAVALAAGLLPASLGWGQTKPQRPQIDVSSINGREIYANSQVGNDTATEVNSAIQNFPDAKVVIITSDMTGNSCDFTGINLTSTQVFLRDERQGKIAWGFLNPGSLQIVCQLQADGNAVNVNTLNVTNFNNGGSGINGLTSGGQVFWTGTGLNYIITAASYNIGGVQYTSPQTSVTLAAADPTNPRIDTFFLDSNGHAGVITGTPAPSPSQPSVDPTTQLAVGFATIAAAATTPSGTSKTLIYDENVGPPAEWTCTTSGTGWNCNDATHPFSGTKDIQSLGTDATSFVKLTDTAAADRSSNNLLGFELRSETAWKQNWEVWATFYNGSTPVGNTVFVQGGSFGWSGSTTGAYQLVAIPLNSFNIGANPVDNVRFRWNKAGNQATNATIYLDNIILENNGVGSGGGGSSSGLSNVIVTGTSSFFPNPLPSTTTAGVQTTNDTPADAPINTVWAGPAGSGSTGVGIANVTSCSSSTATATCSYTVQHAGDFLILGSNASNNGSFGFSTARSDTLGTSFTHFGGSGSTAYDVGQTSAAGSDTISLTSTAATPYSFTIIEVSNAGSFVSANSFNAGQISGASNPISYSHAVSASTTTDGVIEILTAAKTCYAASGLTASPYNALGGTWTASNNTSTGAAWLYGPAGTGSITYSLTSGTAGCSSNYVPMFLVFTQSGAAGSGPAGYKQLNRSFLGGLFPLPVQSVTNFPLASNVTITAANTATNLISQAVTMPSSGCPCRVLVFYNMYTSAPTTTQLEIEINSWVSDGTNNWAGSQTTHLQDTALDIPNDRRALTASQFSPVSYANSQSVTFTLKAAADVAGDVVIMQAPVNSASPVNSTMQITVLPSAN